MEEKASVLERTILEEQFPVSTYTAACLVPVRRFPSPSRSVRFGAVSEANGRETPIQKQNAHACVTF